MEWKSLTTELQMEEATWGSASQEPAGESSGEGKWREVDDWHPKVSLNVHRRWRKASLAINACNRMRLVLESDHPVNKGKAKQVTNTAFDINSLLTEEDWEGIPVDEALSQPQHPDPLFGSSISDEERPCILGKFHIVKRSFTDGILSFAVESKGPVAPENILKIASELHALLEGLRGPESLNPTPVTLPSSNSVEFVYPIFDEYDVGSPDFFASPAQSTAPEMMFNMDDAMQSNALTPEIMQPEITVSVQSSEDFSPIPVLAAAAQISNTSGLRTRSENTSMREGGDGMDCGQDDQASEQHMDQLLKSLRNETLWTGNIAEMKKNIEREFDRVDQASDRLKLENVKSEVQEISGKLNREVKTFDSQLHRWFDELITTVKRYSNSMPNIQQQLLKAISGVINHFKCKELKHLTEEVGKISRNLDQKVFKELKNRELSSTKVFNNCAASVQRLLESRMEEHRHHFIYAPDFVKWYYAEVYNLSTFRLEGGSRPAALQPGRSAHTVLR